MRRHSGLPSRRHLSLAAARDPGMLESLQARFGLPDGGGLRLPALPHQSESDVHRRSRVRAQRDGVWFPLQGRRRLHEPFEVQHGDRQVRTMNRTRAAPLGRRQLLLAAASGLSRLGCSSDGVERISSPRKIDCAIPSDGGDAAYCLVEARSIRVARARALQQGEAVLANIDDNTAVIVARDAEGFHALSAICTHACCLVSLCIVPTCLDVTSNPGACGVSAAVRADETTTAIACPCHGSSFRLSDGAPTGGPERRSLPSYAVSFDGQDVLVDTARLVDPGTRA